MPLAFSKLLRLYISATSQLYITITLAMNARSCDLKGKTDWTTLLLRCSVQQCNTDGPAGIEERRRKQSNNWLRTSLQVLLFDSSTLTMRLSCVSALE